jgi:glycosyltransferase involved in cell wall biosynthesis
MVTQCRNNGAITKAGWVEGRDFTGIDTESTAAPLYAFNEWLRKVTGLGWTLTTAMGSVMYYHFEYEIVRKFGADIDAKKYDVVHRVTPLSPTTPSPFLASRCAKAGVPFIWGPVNGGIPWPKEFTAVQRAEGEWLSSVRDAYKLMPGWSAARKHSAALIAGSISAYEQFSGFSDRTVYIPENAIDPSRFNKVAAPYAGGPIKVCFIGRLVPYKGADMLLEAATPLLRAGKIEIDVIGDGPEMPRLRAMVAENQLEKTVRLDGWVKHEQLNERLASCHVLGFPSVREFGGGVALEAMALGIVPIVVEYGGLAELVTPQSGYLIPIGTRESIVQRLRTTLQQIVEQPSQLTALSEQAKLRVNKYFTWDAKARQTAQVYDWVLGKRDKPDFGMPFPD